jgi:hypothetical protein
MANTYKQEEYLGKTSQVPFINTECNKQKGNKLLQYSVLKFNTVCHRSPKKWCCSPGIAGNRVDPHYSGSFR